MPRLSNALGTRHSVLLELNENGQITRSLHDPTGSAVPGISEVHDDGDVLYFGCYKNPFVGKLVLKD